MCGECSFYYIVSYANKGKTNNILEINLHKTEKRYTFADVFH